MSKPRAITVLKTAKFVQFHTKPRRGQTLWRLRLRDLTAAAENQYGGSRLTKFTAAYGGLQRRLGALQKNRNPKL